MGKEREGLYLENCSHFLLLCYRAMVLNAQNNWQGRSNEGRLCYGLYHVPEGDLGGEGVAVVDDGRSIITVPAVN